MFLKTIRFSTASVKLPVCFPHRRISFLRICVCTCVVSEKYLLRLFSIPLIADDFIAADLRMINWKPSLDSRRTVVGSLLDICARYLSSFEFV